MSTSTDILYVITDLEVGGVPLHLRGLIAAMSKRGLRCVAVSLAPAGPVGEMLRADGVDVFDCGACCGWDVRVIPRLASHIRENKPEVIHSFLFHANVAARFAARMAGYPPERVVCEIQTVEVERRWHLLADRFTHGDCRFTIGNSPSVVQHLHEKARIPKSRLRLVRGGIDAERILAAKPPSRAELGVSEDARIVFWVGRLDPVKGLTHLIEAFAQVLSRVRTAVLVLAGDGPIRSSLEEQVSRLGIGDAVKFLGSRNDVPSLLQAADAFVFPSRTEGLPNALLEAMAAGKAIVTTDVPGCRDLICDGENGLVVQYGDVSALAGEMTRILTDDALARKLSRHAECDAEHDWRIESTYEAYAETYRDMLSPRN